MNPLPAPAQRRLCAVLTCFNRKDKTLACLAALQASRGVEQWAVQAVLVDDGSTDGTLNTLWSAAQIAPRRMLRGPNN